MGEMGMGPSCDEQPKPSPMGRSDPANQKKSIVPHLDGCESNDFEERNRGTSNPASLSVGTLPPGPRRRGGPSTEFECKGPGEQQNIDLRGPELESRRRILYRAKGASLTPAHRGHAHHAARASISARHSERKSQERDIPRDIPRESNSDPAASRHSENDAEIRGDLLKSPQAAWPIETRNEGTRLGRTGPRGLCQKRVPDISSKYLELPPAHRSHEQRSLKPRTEGPRNPDFPAAGRI